MGQSSAKFTKDTLAAENSRRDHEATQRTVRKAVNKCLDKDLMRQPGNSSTELTMEELTCVEEYAMLYTQYLKNAFNDFQVKYEAFGREQMERQREMMRQQQQQAK